MEQWTFRAREYFSGGGPRGIAAQVEPEVAEIFGVSEP